MKVKVVITANIKKPKVGNNYGGYGLDGRSGYFEVLIRRVHKKLFCCWRKKDKYGTVYLRPSNNQLA